MRICKWFYSVLLLLIAIPANSAEMNSKMVADGEGVTYINDHYLKNHKAHYEIYDGLAVMEGDILLGPVEKLDSSITTRAATVRNGGRWPKGIIPYQFASHVSSTTRNNTINAMNKWMQHTYIRFVPRTNQSKYISINSYDNLGCRSYVGYGQAYLYGKQDLNLASGCGYTEALHELGHAIGLYHEHNRADRDDYVDIKWNNIKSGAESNYYKYTTHMGYDINNYDYNSIMHYGAYFFAIDRTEPTIVPKYTSLSGIGKKTLSNGDVSAVNHMYYPNPAQITAPSTKYRLPGKTATFKWSYTGANSVYLKVGNVYSSWVYGNNITITNLPTDGRDITVTLMTFIPGETSARQYTYNYKAFLAKPSKPSSLTTADIGSSQVTLRWRDNSNNEKGFRIYRGNTLIKTLPANTRSYTITNLNENTAYTYTIRSYNDAGVSAPITVKFRTKKINMSSWYVPVDYNMVY